MNKITNRQIICEVLSEHAKTDKDIVVLCSDSRGSASLAPFSKEFPDQFVEVGIAEQDLVGISAGLAKMGKKPYALQGKIVIGADTLATLSDREMVARFRDYTERKAEFTDATERINRTHREYGNTYWWYYDFSHLAKGELQQANTNPSNPHE